MEGHALAAPRAEAVSQDGILQIARGSWRWGPKMGGLGVR